LFLVVNWKSAIRSIKLNSSLLTVGKSLVIMASAPYDVGAAGTGTSPGKFDSTLETAILPVLASSRDAVLIQWVPVVDLFEEEFMHGLPSQTIFQVISGCSLNPRHATYEFRRRPCHLA
jgi:hypothetical protein